jgi:ATP-dependent Clp protease adaptor protein ClpS
MTSKETKKYPVNKPKDEDREDYSLILYNDDFHSFDYVIEALVEICQHQYEQAVQCTLITHHKGSCTVRKGNKEILNKMREALSERELNTAIDIES